MDSLEKELLKLTRPQHKDVTEVLKRFHEEVHYHSLTMWCQYKWDLGCLYYALLLLLVSAAVGIVIYKPNY